MGDLLRSQRSHRDSVERTLPRSVVANITRVIPGAIAARGWTGTRGRSGSGQAATIISLVEQEGAASFRILEPRQRPQVLRVARQVAAAGLQVLVLGQTGGATALHVARPGVPFNTVSHEPHAGHAGPWRIVYRAKGTP